MELRKFTTKRSRGRTVLMSAAALLTTIALGSPGCKTADLEAYCEEVASCEGLNGKDTEACVVVQETREYVDCDIGCGDEHAEYYDCILDKGSCRTEASGQPCQTSDDCFGGQCTTNMVCETKRFTVEGDDCKAVREAYQSCSFN
jgi:hypothetical protein